MLVRAARAADDLSLKLQLNQQLQLCILVFVLCSSDGSSDLWHPQPSSYIQQKSCCVLENHSPSEVQGWILQLLKTLALVQQIQKNPSELPALVSLNEACLSAWLGWVSAQYLAGSSHYLCCNAPVPAGSGRGGGL